MFNYSELTLYIYIDSGFSVENFSPDSDCLQDSLEECYSYNFEDPSILEQRSKSPNFLKFINILGNYDIDSIFPPLDGTSFYLNICKINHNCNPSVKVCYELQNDSTNNESKYHGLVAVVKSLDFIEKGSEIFQSYIDSDLPFNLRRENLKEYDIECNCQLCLLKN